MRQTYGANFISQSVGILTPVLVFLGPFVAFSIAMQWDFFPKDSFNIFYGIFFGGLIWFLVCVAACLCTAMPRPSSPEEQATEKKLWKYARKCLKVVLMFFLISIGLVLTQRYDLFAKKERYLIAHQKFCAQDLSQPLNRLMATHQNFGQVEQKHWSASTVKDAYMESINTLSAWIDSTSWDTTVVLTDKDTLSLTSSVTNYLPIQKKSVSDYPGLEKVSSSLGAPICETIRVNGHWKSLRVLSYEGQRPAAILTKVREERSRY